MSDFRKYLTEKQSLTECKAKIKSLEKKLAKCDDKSKCKKIKAEIAKCKKKMNEGYTKEIFDPSTLSQGTLNLAGFGTMAFLFGSMAVMIAKQAISNFISNRNTRIAADSILKTPEGQKFATLIKSKNVDANELYGQFHDKLESLLSPELVEKIDGDLHQVCHDLIVKVRKENPIQSEEALPESYVKEWIGGSMLMAPEFAELWRELRKCEDEGDSERCVSIKLRMDKIVDDLQAKYKNKKFGEEHSWREQPY
jgi:hypothetical protein